MPTAQQKVLYYSVRIACGISRNRFWPPLPCKETVSWTLTVVWFICFMHVVVRQNGECSIAMYYVTTLSFAKTVNVKLHSNCRSRGENDKLQGSAVMCLCYVVFLSNQSSIAQNILQIIMVEQIADGFSNQNRDQPGVPGWHPLQNQIARATKPCSRP